MKPTILVHRWYTNEVSKPIQPEISGLDTGREIEMSQGNVATQSRNWQMAVAIGSHLDTYGDVLELLSLPHDDFIIEATLIEDGGCTIHLKRESTLLAHQIVTRQQLTGDYRYICRQLSGNESKIDTRIGGLECHFVARCHPWEESCSKSWQDFMRSKCARQQRPFLTGAFLFPRELEIEYSALTIEQHSGIIDVLVATSIPKQGMLISQAVFTKF